LPSEDTYVLYRQACLCGIVNNERDFAGGLYTHLGGLLQQVRDYIADPKTKSFAIAKRGKTGKKILKPTLQIETVLANTIEVSG
jgi:hypothetical protein